ncbi:MAG: threonine/serine exporter family protein [Butyricicoccus sp.]
METHDRRVLNLAVGAGTVLLQCGAEIARVEDTTKRIACAYGVEECSLFVMISGIFMTAISGKDELYAKIRYIPLAGTQLNKVDAVNQLSREISAGNLSLDEAEQRLDDIQNMGGKSNTEMALAYGVGAAAFTRVIGGSWADCGASFLAGVFLYLFIMLLSLRAKHTAKLLWNIVGAFIATAAGMLLWRAGLGDDYGMIAVGAIMPLLPGVSFVNSIRDFGNGDYLSGAVRLIDTALVTLGIALGVGLAFQIVYQGGVI